MGMGIAKFLTKPDNKSLPYFQALLLICAIVLTIPNLIMDAGGELDASWEMGLHKANIQQMIHGKDVLFTYGPLGFLVFPIFISRSLWLYSAGYTLSIYALTLFSFSLYIRKIKANLINTVIFAIIFIAVFRAAFSGSDFGLLLSIFIFSYLYVLGRKRPLLLFGLVFLHSILPFIKFSHALAGLVIGVAFLFVLVRDKRGKEAFVFLISGILVFTMVSLLLLGSPKAVVMYLYGCLQISGGYSDAMGLNGIVVFYGAKSQLLLSIIAWLSYIGLFSYNAFKKRRSDIIYLVFAFSLLFISFKHGFVRHDLHVVYFYSMWMLVFALYYLKSFHEAKIVRYMVLLLTLIMFYQYVNISAVSERYTGSGIYDKAKNLQLSYNLLRGVGTERQEEQVKNGISRFYELKAETIKMLSGYTIDIFPWDIAITELYGFRWHPRPVFQSYSAYTAYLDLLNAKHFSSDYAPEYVLYAMKSIDGRYPIFDEPATFRTLLQKYEPFAVDGKFIVLRRKDNVETGTEEYLQKAAVGFGDIIALPRVEDGLLFAKIYVEYNLLGYVSKFLFKPPEVYFGFLKNRQPIGTHRFIFSNAENGLFLSRHIADRDDLHRVWRGDTKENLSEIAILTKHPAFFKDKITVEFFKVVTKAQEKRKVPF